MRKERSDHTLRPTELVHEVYLLLQKQRSLKVKDRAHFVSLASGIMRRVLVNYAVRRKSKKRGEGRETMMLDDNATKTLVDFERDRVDIIALEYSLLELARRDARQVKIVELHFYGGLTFEEIAEFLEISLSSVMREWRFARTWLFQNLSRGNSDTYE